MCKFSKYFDDDPSGVILEIKEHVKNVEDEREQAIGILRRLEEVFDVWDEYDDPTMILEWFGNVAQEAKEWLIPYRPKEVSK